MREQKCLFPQTGSGQLRIQVCTFQHSVKERHFDTSITMQLPHMSGTQAPSLDVLRDRQFCSSVCASHHMAMVLRALSKHVRIDNAQPAI